ncbi:MAG: peptidoglycan editing factor PgeF [Alphaproteobacteria bacterium]|nr:peptidoglycan editing factor PgeF [Alphaproteobacteria bacterium]
MKFLTTGLDDIKWVSHGFFTRLGGASEGLYDSLNCALSSGDAPERVRANRAKVAEVLDLDPENIITLKQVHSANVITVDKPWDSRAKTPEADALVTDRPGLGIAVLTADCAPVLFASKKDKIVGAAHAGWKGALHGVLEATVAQMSVLGAKPSDIVAAIGPCIGPQSYEVSEGFDAPFIEQDAENAKFFKPAENPGHLVFDLPGYAASRLEALGIETVLDTKRDTLTGEDVFFSYRRSTKRKEPDYGRQISVIALKGRAGG